MQRRKYSRTHLAIYCLVWMVARICQMISSSMAKRNKNMTNVWKRCWRDWDKRTLNWTKIDAWSLRIMCVSTGTYSVQMALPQTRIKLLQSSMQPPHRTLVKYVLCSEMGPVCVTIHTSLCRNHCRTERTNSQRCTLDLEEGASASTRQLENQVNQCVHCSVLWSDKTVKGTGRCESSRHWGDAMPGWQSCVLRQPSFVCCRTEIFTDRERDVSSGVGSWTFSSISLRSAVRDHQWPHTASRDLRKP